MTSGTHNLGKHNGKLIFVKTGEGGLRLSAIADSGKTEIFLSTGQVALLKELLA